MLQGQAKTDYQREYMRRRRASAKEPQVRVRPLGIFVRPAIDSVRPYEDTLIQPSPFQSIDTFATTGTEEPKPQSYNPMMVGYVPPDGA